LEQQLDTDSNKPPITFFMVGCPRCGTTWVHAALKDHPQVFLPEKKQTYFFNQYYDKGIDWYLDNFANARGDFRAVGEIATGYSMPHAVPRLAEHFPDVQLMIAMRNPTERAYSFYQSRAVSEGWKSLKEAVAAQPEILEQGKYADQIEHLYQFYPRDRLLMLFYDDLRANDREYLGSILNFLGLDSSYESPQLGRMVQVAAFPRLRRTLRRMKLGPLLDFISKTSFGDFLRKQIKSRGIRRYPPIDAETKKYLIDYYKPFNDRLQELSGRDLSHWNS
jgi:hypothetical protein